MQPTVLDLDLRAPKPLRPDMGRAGRDGERERVCGVRGRARRQCWVDTGMCCTTVAGVGGVAFADVAINEMCSTTGPAPARQAARCASKIARVHRHAGGEMRVAVIPRVDLQIRIEAAVPCAAGRLKVWLMPSASRKPCAAGLSQLAQSRARSRIGRWGRSSRRCWCLTSCADARVVQALVDDDARIRWPWAGRLQR